MTTENNIWKSPNEHKEFFFLQLDQILLNEGKNTAVAKQIQQLQLSVTTWTRSLQTGLLWHVKLVMQHRD